jgi:hypothetical protein
LNTFCQKALSGSLRWISEFASAKFAMGSAHVDDIADGLTNCHLANNEVQQYTWGSSGNIFA